MRPAAVLRDRPGGGVAVAVLGAALAVLAVLSQLRGSGSDALPFQAVFEVAVVELLSLSVLGAGVWLIRSDVPRRNRWFVAGWTYLGGLSLATLAGAALLESYWQRRPVDFEFVLLLAVATGAGAGLLVGLSNERTRQYAREVETQREQLRFLNRLLRHNVLNAMNVVEGRTALLAETVDPPASQHVEPIRAQSERIATLVQNVEILGDSFLGEGDLGPVAVDGVLAAELERARATFPEATFEADLDGEVSVVADDLLGAVFENLLRNAVEHHDREDPEVSVSLATDEGYAVVEVADDGPGLTAESNPFDPGEHGDAGLGLYVTRILVERYGGDVSIRPDDSRGTTVTVRLPRA